jgi:hypothetical protein
LNRDELCAARLMAPPSWALALAEIKNNANAVNTIFIVLIFCYLIFYKV